MKCKKFRWEKIGSFNILVICLDYIYIVSIISEHEMNMICVIEYMIENCRLMIWLIETLRFCLQII